MLRILKIFLALLIVATGLAGGGTGTRILEERAIVHVGLHQPAIFFDATAPDPFSIQIESETDVAQFGQLPGLRFFVFAAASPRVLIAGCGTGKDAIWIASNIANARVLATFAGATPGTRSASSRKCCARPTPATAWRSRSGCRKAPRASTIPKVSTLCWCCSGTAKVATFVACGNKAGTSEQTCITIDEPQPNTPPTIEILGPVDGETFGAGSLYEAGIVTHFARVAGDRVDMGHDI